MPFDGNGNFTRVHNWQDDADNGIDIEPDRADEEDDNFADGLSDCMTRDGQSPATADIPFGGNKVTDLADGDDRDDASSVGQVQDGVLNWVEATGTADAMVGVFSPPITALLDGQLCHVRTIGANTVTNPTFKANGTDLHTITQTGGDALAVGAYGDDEELILRYNLANTRWEWLNSRTPASTSFTDSTFRIKDDADPTKQIAFQASTIGTGQTRVVTVPDGNTSLPIVPQVITFTGMTVGRTYTLPDADASLVPSILYSHIAGFSPNITNTGATTAAITVAAGQAADSTNAAYITKATTTSWLVSNGNAINGYSGGTTLPNSSTIHFFACYGSSGVGVYAHNGLTPTPPTGYNTYYRRIFSVRTTGAGALIPYVPIEVEGGALLCFLTTQTLDFNSNLTATAALLPLTVPTGIKVLANFHANSTTNGYVGAIYTSPDQPDVAPSVSGSGGFNGAAPGFHHNSQSTVIGVSVANMFVLTDTSGQIRGRASNTMAIQLVTESFKDFRR